MILAPANRRGQAVATALRDGARRLGIEATVDRGPVRPSIVRRYRALACYGIRGHLELLRSARTGILLDLGYWGRRTGENRWDGYYRVAVDGIHPNGYYRRRAHLGNRVGNGAPTVAPARRVDDGYVLLAGMSDKAASVYGLAPEQWERRAAERLLATTRRPVLYRPKPSWRGFSRIAGTELDDVRRSATDAVRGAWAVVTHHSNIALTAVCAGVPVYGVEDGVGLDACSGPIESVEDWSLPSAEWRQQWLQDVSYAQWTLDEIAAGRMFRHLLSEGLL